jgi:hypothetical protein
MLQAHHRLYRYRYLGLQDNSLVDLVEKGESGAGKRVRLGAAPEPFKARALQVWNELRPKVMGYKALHANVHQLVLIMQHADYPHYLERLMRDLPLEVLQELNEASFTTEAGVLENAHLFAKMFVADCK